MMTIVFELFFFLTSSTSQLDDEGCTQCEGYLSIFLKEC